MASIPSTLHNSLFLRTSHALFIVGEKKKTHGRPLNWTIPRYGERREREGNLNNEGCMGGGNYLMGWGTSYEARAFIPPSHDFATATPAG